MKSRHLRSTLVVVSCLAFTPVSNAYSAAETAAENPTSDTIKSKIKHAMKKGSSLKSFYTSLGREYGTKAVKPLIEIVSDNNNSDETRWASLFGIARLTGKDSVGLLKKFMSHSSWMLRDAALKSAAAVDAKELTPQIEQRLKDKALVVRTTAVQAIGHLNLRESAPKLVDALFDPMNYHAGKGLWIHQHILQVLRSFNYTASVPRLVQLLERSNDEKLQTRVIGTLEALTGKSFKDKALKEQIYLWKRNTLSELTF